MFISDLCIHPRLDRERNERSREDEGKGARGEGGGRPPHPQKLPSHYYNINN